MKHVKVKICGIRSIEAAQAAVNAGADFIGLNFIPTSKRVISIERAVEIANSVQGKIQLVGIFANQSIQAVNSIAEQVGLNYVQLHGNETMDFISQIKKPVIKTFSLDTNFDVENVVAEMQKFSVTYYFVDRAKQGHGEMLSFDKLKQLSEKIPIFVAGGLTPENVSEVIAQVQPYGVDVAGGIETDEREDVEKIKSFVKHAKELPI